MKNDIKIKLSPYELRILVKATNEMRTDFIKNNTTTEDIDEILLKLINKYEKITGSF